MSFDDKDRVFNKAFALSSPAVTKASCVYYKLTFLEKLEITLFAV